MSAGCFSSEKTIFSAPVGTGAAALSALSAFSTARCVPAPSTRYFAAVYSSMSVCQLRWFGEMLVIAAAHAAFCMVMS